MCQTVRDRFWDRRLNGADWTALCNQYHAKLPQVKSKAQFTDLVNQLLDGLHASHTSYINDDDVQFYMLPAVMARDMDEHRVEHIGVMGRYDAGEYLITAILDDGPALKAGLHAGDRIVSADGAPFTTAGSFRGKDGKQVMLAVKRDGTSTVSMIPVVPVMQNMLRAYLNATRASVRVIEVKGKRIGYVHLWTMANDNFKTLLESLVVTRLHDTDGLILDLRDGYGGTPFGYIDVFTRPDVAWESQSRGGPGNATHTGYNQPIVALINEGTRSAKEFFSYQLKSSHRAILVGKQTAGAFLGAGSFPISQYGLLEMAIVGLKVDGVKLESNGVKPDFDVDEKNAYTDRDQQFVTGEDRLLEQLSKGGKVLGY
jgi:carboxyl-terminal processing protease